MSVKYNYIDPKLVPLRKKFVNAFAIDAQTKKNIVESMLKNGWDNDQQIILAKLHDDTPLFCIDGHTRVQSSIEAGIARITYIIKEFPNEDEAFAYVQSLQFNRRNLSDRDKVAMIQSNAGYESAKNKKQFIAQLLHISERSAAKYMTILKDPEKLRAVLDDKETVNSAQVLKKERTKSKALEYAEKVAREIDTEEIDATEIEVLRELLKSINKKLGVRK